MKEKILAYLTIVPSATAEMISSEAGIDPRECQNMLHAMDDAGQVLMRQGWYRLSEARKAGRGSPSQPSDQALEALYPASSLPKAEEEDTSG